MSFLHGTLLLAGALLIGIPLLLHLLMRPRPKTVPFPAVRFLVDRQRTNQRRLRLQHLALLAARMLVILLLAAALARPHVASAQMGSWLTFGGLVLVWLVLAGVWLASWGRPMPRWLRGSVTSAAALATLLVLATATIMAAGGSARIRWGSREAPVAAALVVDTSPRMEYQHQNQTRLELAKEMALGVIQQLPPESEIAVVDAAGGATGFALGTAAARTAIDGLATSGAQRPLAQLAIEALELLETSEKTSRELYIFTDLSASAWQADERRRLEESLAKQSETRVQVIDVGVESPRNFGIAQVQLAADHLPRQRPVDLAVTIHHTGGGGTCRVECLVEKPDATLPVIRDGKVVLPEMTARDRAQVEFPQAGEQTIRFRLHDLPAGLHHGMVRILGDDGLALDDQAPFTVEVTEPQTIAVVGGPGAVNEFLVSALDPPTAEGALETPFACESWRVADLTTRDLSSVRAVALVDPEPLPDAAWHALRQAVENGCGLALFVGRNAAPAEAFQGAAAMELLPGALARQWRTPAGVTLVISNEDHPIVRPLRDWETAIPWQQFPVFRHWGLETIAPGAVVIARYSNRQPALVERRVGKGGVILMTTPVSDPASDRDAWNLLPTGEEPWPFLVLMDQLFHYLTRGSDPSLNYLTGQPVALPSWTGPSAGRYQLFTPAGEWQEIRASQGELRVGLTDRPGVYRIRSDRPGDPPRGFSVQLPPDAGRLERLASDELDALEKQGRLQIVRSTEEIQRGVSEARVGVDAFAFFAVLLAVLLAMESFLANWFYAPAGPEAASAPGRAVRAVVEV